VATILIIFLAHELIK